MAGRKHHNHHHLQSSLTRRDESRLSHSSSSSTSRSLEDRIESRHREIQSLLLDNQRLATTHLALKQDLSATQQELRQLSAAAADVKAERDAEVRRIYEKSLKMDAEVRAVVAMRNELDQVRADVRELAGSRKELVVHLQGVKSDLALARNDLKPLPAIKDDIEALRHDIQRGRNAIEIEKKTHANNLEHKRVMDNNMIIMTREVEKLRAELANAEKRERAAIVAAANPSNLNFLVQDIVQTILIWGLVESHTLLILMACIRSKLGLKFIHNMHTEQHYIIPMTFNIHKCQDRLPAMFYFMKVKGN